jgi:hypothetical protein
LANHFQLRIASLGAPWTTPLAGPITLLLGRFGRKEEAHLVATRPA